MPVSVASLAKTIAATPTASIRTTLLAVAGRLAYALYTLAPFPYPALRPVSGVAPGSCAIGGSAYLARLRRVHLAIRVARFADQAETCLDFLRTARRVFA